MKLKKLLKNSLVLIFAMSMMSLGTSYFCAEYSYNKAYSVQATVNQKNNSSTKAVQKTKNSTDDEESIPEKNVKEIEHFEHKQNGLLKFAIAMLWVFLSAGVIFVLLKLYQKFFMKRKNKMIEPDTFGQANSLDSPKTMKEALNLFLEKTDD